MSFMFQFPGNGKKWPRTQAKHGDVIEENVSHFFQTFSYAVSLEPLCSGQQKLLIVYKLKKVNIILDVFLFSNKANRRQAFCLL